jgi:hypothetical protein
MMGKSNGNEFWVRCEVTNRPAQLPRVINFVCRPEESFAVNAQRTRGCRQIPSSLLTQFYEISSIGSRLFLH